MTVELVSGDYEKFSIIFAKNETYETRFQYLKSAETIAFDRTRCGLTKDVVCRR